MDAGHNKKDVVMAALQKLEKNWKKRNNNEEEGRWITFFNFVKLKLIREKKAAVTHLDA